MIPKDIRYRVSAIMTVLLVTGVAGIAFVHLGSRRTKGVPPAVSFHALKRGEPKPYMASPLSPADAIFLVTNRTDKTLMALPVSIEVKAGSNWSTQMRLLRPLSFSGPGSIRMPGETNAIIANLTTPELKPHQAAYCTIHFSGQPTANGPGPGSPNGCGMNYLAGEPTGAVWRLTVSMQEQLTGLRLAAARLTHYADTRRSYATAGITNSPFSCLYLGKPTTVSSEEVTWSDQ